MKSKLLCGLIEYLFIFIYLFAGFLLSLCLVAILVKFPYALYIIIMVYGLYNAIRYGVFEFRR